MVLYPYQNCLKSTERFALKLTEIYDEVYQPDTPYIIIHNEILNWLRNGTESKYVNELLSSPDDAKNFPHSFQSHSTWC